MPNVEHNLVVRGDMATLIWDKVGERVYQGGIDRGVLYLQEGKAVVWNGLTGVEDASNSELKSFYLDGVKYLQTLLPQEFVGKLKAITYPDEFEAIIGTVPVIEGFYAREQPPKSFNLSYRSRIGDDIDGIEHGYKIHILYNIVANPDPYAFNTFSDAGAQPVEFVWNLTGTPEKMFRIRPAVHVVIDSTKTTPEIMQMLEEKLYGTEMSNASLPSLQDIADYFGYLAALLIIDHGDGTWTAIDEGNDYIVMLDPTTFSIENADTVILDTNTYTISSTNAS